MPIDKETQEKIKKRLEEKIENWECESCGAISWIISNYYFPAPISEIPNQITIGEKLQPLINMTCTKCGYTRFYNLIQLGLMDELTKAKKEEKKSEDKEGE